MPADYPVHGEKATILKRETLADSVMTADDYQLHGDTAEHYLSDLPPPVYPGSDAYWKELRRVAEVQVIRRNKGDLNSVTRWPDLWAAYDLDQIAKIVHNEYPASLQQELIEQLFTDGVELNYDVMRKHERNGVICVCVLSHFALTFVFFSVSHHSLSIGQ
jgi:hypothetical protein